MNKLKFVVDKFSSSVATRRSSGWTTTTSKAPEVNIELNRLQVAWHG
jgi:hypothetical protein